MATATFNSDVLQETPDNVAPAGQGFFARLLKRMTEARMAQARVRVNEYLAQLNDHSLKEIGFSDAEIEAVHNRVWDGNMRLHE